MPAISANCKPRKKFKLGKNELVKMDVTALAQHITMLEWRLFSRIKEQECLNWAHTQHGSSVARITAFCATHDRLATWVKHTVLANDGLGKRADMVDFWIKVAEVSPHHPYARKRRRD